MAAWSGCQVEPLVGLLWGVVGAHLGQHQLGQPGADGVVVQRSGLSRVALGVVEHGHRLGEATALGGRALGVAAGRQAQDRQALEKVEILDQGRALELGLGEEALHVDRQQRILEDLLGEEVFGVAEIGVAAVGDVHRAAEDAVSEAGPVFVNSVKSMTIEDAIGILRGSEHAATEYLQRTTYQQLFELYRPKIQNSLDKKLVGNVSTAQSWSTLTTRWNEIANSLVGQVAGFKPVETNLDVYLTDKALEGLFLKIANEEERIRENPAARVTEILRRVFGSVDN